MKIDTAVVLAGGPATRLKPLSNKVPKGLIKVYRKPLLQWIIEWLRDNEVKGIILGVAYLRRKIINYFGDGTGLGVNITYSVHTVAGGTGEAFRLAISRYVDRDVFFAMNGDQITDLNLSALAGFHANHNSVATMVITNPYCTFGHVKVNKEYDATGFMEKPHCPHAFCNAGIYVFNHEILRYLPEKGDVEKTTFPLLAKARNLKVYPFNGFFATINTPKDLIEAERKLRRMRE